MMILACGRFKREQVGEHKKSPGEGALNEMGLAADDPDYRKYNKQTIASNNKKNLNLCQPLDTVRARECAPTPADAAQCHA